jgi:hypothetical protein
VSGDWPFPNRTLPGGTWICGTDYAAILFKPNRSVAIIRRPEADSKSLIGRLGGLNEVVDDLVWLAKDDPDIPHVRGLLRDIIYTEDDQKAAERLSDFSRQVRAARIWFWGLLRGAGPYQSFFRELKKLSEELHQPPSKRLLAKALGLENNAWRMSKICRETGFDWLPNDKPGPKTFKKRR